MTWKNFVKNWLRMKFVVDIQTEERERRRRMAANRPSKLNRANRELEYMRRKKGRKLGICQ